jgi:hypothetical protein
LKVLFDQVRYQGLEADALAQMAASDKDDSVSTIM